MATKKALKKKPVANKVVKKSAAPKKAVAKKKLVAKNCLLYTSDAADE